MFGSVQVAVWVLVITVLGVFGMSVLVFVVLRRPGHIVVTIAVRMGMRMLMPRMVGVIRVAVDVLGVLRCLCHCRSFVDLPVAGNGLRLAPAYATIYVCVQIDEQSADGSHLTRWMTIRF